MHLKISHQSIHFLENDQFIFEKLQFNLMTEQPDSEFNIQSYTISQRKIPSLNMRPIDFKNKFEDLSSSRTYTDQSIADEMEQINVNDQKKGTLIASQDPSESRQIKDNSPKSKQDHQIQSFSKINSDSPAKSQIEKLKNGSDSPMNVKKRGSVSIENPRRDSIFSQLWNKITRKSSIQGNLEEANPNTKSKFSNSKGPDQKANKSDKKQDAVAAPFNGFGGILSVIRKARVMGLWNKNSAFNDILTREQLFMIKDLAGGKYDKKEAERSKQLNKKKQVTKYITKSDKKTNKSIIVIVNQTKLQKLVQKYLLPIKEFLIILTKKVFTIITPDNKFRIGWDFGLMFLILYDLIMVPLRLSFDLEVPYAISIWEIFIDSLFICDILFNFQTGYYEKGLLVMDRKSIAKHYVSSFFLFDIISSFPYSYIELFFEESAATTNLLKTLRFLRFMKLMRFVRVLKLKKIFSKIESYIDFTPAVTSLIGFFKLSITILFIAHFIACFWHLVASLEIGESRITWLSQYDFQDLIWYKRYVISIYWATTTMITVGYGDITPATTIERIFAIVTMITASGVFAYTMNRINYLLSGLDTASETYKHALAAITNYMKKKHVRKELQIKIKKYLEYALEVETSIDSNEAYLNTYLNNSLKAELIEEIHGNFLYNSNIFLLFEQSMLAKLAHYVQEIFYSPEDTIFLDNDVRDLGIYFVNSGKVEIFNLASNALLKVLYRGTHFGEVSFFTGQPRTASARSVDFSSLYFITQDDFMELLEGYPFEKEKYCEIRDKILFGNQYEILNMACYSCNEKGHLVKDCPIIHFTVDKKEFLSTYLKKRILFHQNFVRKGTRTKRFTGKYLRLLQAANEIQEKIYEKKLIIDKELLPDYMQDDNSQDMSRGSHINRLNSMERPSVVKDKPMSSENPKTKLERSSTNVEFAFVAKRFESRLTMDAQNQVAATNKKQIESPFESGFDRVLNFKYYFPDYNFSKLFPKEEFPTIIFDYGVEIYSDSIKKYLIKFIDILKSKVKARHEREARRDTENLMTNQDEAETHEKSQFKRSATIKNKGSMNKGIPESPSKLKQDSKRDSIVNIPLNTGIQRKNSVTQPVILRFGSSNRLNSNQSILGIKYTSNVGSVNNASYNPISNNTVGSNLNTDNVKT